MSDKDRLRQFAKIFNCYTSWNIGGKFPQEAQDLGAAEMVTLGHGQGFTNWAPKWWEETGYIFNEVGSLLGVYNEKLELFVPTTDSDE